MTIKTIPVEWVVEKAYCDCGGEMIKTGFSNSVDIELKCNKCDKTERAVHGYPNLKYREK